MTHTILIRAEISTIYWVVIELLTEVSCHYLCMHSLKTLIKEIRRKEAFIIPYDVSILLRGILFLGIRGYNVDQLKINFIASKESATEWIVYDNMINRFFKLIKFIRRYGENKDVCKKYGQPGIVTRPAWRPRYVETRRVTCARHLLAYCDITC